MNAYSIAEIFSRVEIQREIEMMCIAKPTFLIPILSDGQSFLMSGFGSCQKVIWMGCNIKTHSV